MSVRLLGLMVLPQENSANSADFTAARTNPPDGSAGLNFLAKKERKVGLIHGDSYAMMGEIEAGIPVGVPKFILYAVRRKR